MADQEKAGTVWTDDELDAIVADYFDMLDAELNKRPYVKSHHSAALMDRIGRTHRAVEFKHQNISAVLDELGIPWIPGYKPKRNYQNAIFDAIDRYLSTHGELGVIPSRVPPDEIDEPLFVPAPEVAERVGQPTRLAQLVQKFDPGFPEPGAR